MSDSSVGRPSETGRGQRWLANFHPTDRDLATLLIDSLEIAGPNRVRQSLQQRLESSLEIAKPALLVPALSIEDIASATPSGAPHVAYVSFHPGDRIAVTPGSEALMGNLIRDFTGDRAGREPSGWLHPANGIEQLRRQQVRSIVLLTDHVGSGTQIVTYAQTFTRNATIRSWRSLGLIKILVLAHAVSATGLATVRRSSAIDGLEFEYPAPSFAAAQWEPQDRADIEDLCRRYAPLAGSRSPLGYKASAGLYATTTSVPNNLPGILWHETPGWQPFFDGRRVPSDLLEELPEFSPSRDQATAARLFRQERLARVIRTGRFTDRAGEMLLILAALNSARLDTHGLAQRLSLSTSAVQSCLKFLIHEGILDDDLRPTERGREELRASKRLSRRVSANLHEAKEAPYYPQDLR